MKVSVVLGLAFGDEGKGVTTQWLCMQALKYGRKPIVIRFNGGAQAAHARDGNGASIHVHALGDSLRAST